MRELPQRLLERLITDFDKDHWKKICSTFWLSEELIDKYSDRLNWDEVSFYQKLNYSAIDKYADKLSWNYVSKYQKLSEELIDKYSSKVDWSHIFKYQELSEDFIRKNMGKLDSFGEISLLNKLKKNNYSEEIQLFKIDLLGYLFNDHLFYINNELSEDFIRKYKDEVDWYYISRYQKLSEEFVREFRDQVFLDL